MKERVRLSGVTREELVLTLAAKPVGRTGHTRAAQQVDSAITRHTRSSRGGWDMLTKDEEEPHSTSGNACGLK